MATWRALDVAAGEQLPVADSHGSGLPASPQEPGKWTETGSPCLWAAL